MLPLFWCCGENGAVFYIEGWKKDVEEMNLSHRNTDNEEIPFLHQYKRKSGCEDYDPFYLNIFLISRNIKE